MKRFLLFPIATLLVLSMAGTAVGATVTKTISATYLGDSAIQANPIINKTGFVVGQQYTLFTISFDDESLCWTEYYDAGGVYNAGCLPSSSYDWYTDADITLSSAMAAALALYTECPDRRNVHWDHAYSSVGSSWQGADSKYDLWELYAFWNEGVPESTTNHFDFWITGFVDGTSCPATSGNSNNEFVELNFGQPISVSDGSGGGEDVVEIWDCGGASGATFEDGYTVNVTVDPPYAGLWYQVEDDADGLCQDFKDDNPDFACNQHGDGSLVTSKIDDDVDPAAPLDFHQWTSGATLVVGDSEVTGSPTYAMVHANVFEPGECATVFSCDHDGDLGTAEVDCYDSGFGGGPFVGGYFGSAYDACAETFDHTSAGYWAELNDNGGMISPNRNPKKTANNNWAMYVELAAPDCEGTVTVDSDTLDYVATESPPTCASASRSFNGIVDGGDYFRDGGIIAGSVEFTPVADCTATYVCDSHDGVTCLVEPD